MGRWLYRTSLVAADLIEETKTTPLVIHHSTKRAQDSEPFSAQELVRGSGDITAMTGSILGLWRSNKHNSVKALVTGRINAPPAFQLRPRPDEEDVLTANIAPLTFDGWWEKSDDPALSALEAVRAIHSQTGKPVTWQQVAEETGKGRTAIFEHLNALKQRNLLSKLPTSGWLPVSKAA